MSTVAAARQFDLVLYGATGFTGRLCAEYLVANAPASLRVALAGRDAAKLEALKSSLQGCAYPTIAASGQEALNALAASAKVVITTAGPYALYGEPLLKACVAAGTSYADLTGENFWAQRMMAKYGAEASKSGAIIVNMCGFDSIPADLGVFYLLKHARAVHGARVSDVMGLMVGSGNVSGGTIASALNMMRTPGAEAEGSDPLCMFPRSEAEAAGVAPSSIVRPLPDSRALPFWEPFTRTYAGTFVMAAINTRIVRRSAGIFALSGAKLRGHPAALPSLPSGSESQASSTSGGGSASVTGDQRYSTGPFGYSEHMGLPSYVAALGLNASMGAMGLVAKLPGAVSCVSRLVPQPGEGPSAEARAAAHFDYYLIGTTEASPTVPPRRIVACVSGGDGGYTETSKMLCEAGMALATQREGLPGRALGGGFLTPAAAFGSVLVDALHARGMAFTIKGDEPLPAA